MSASRPESTSLPDLCAAIGRTPLLRLRALSAATGCTILGKAEFMNPGGSVKDRAARAMIEAAEAAGELRPGGVIVEASAGNTGIGLAWIGRARGYRVVIVLPESQSPEKAALLGALGAEVRRAPAVPFSHPDHYVAAARRLAAATPGGWFADQFDNLANRRAHRETTGPEIRSQTGGRVDAFVAAIGSGGTIAGVADDLKAHRPEVRIVAAEPDGGAMEAWIRHGRIEASAGESIAEGIGQTRVTRNLEGARIDGAERIADRLAVRVLLHLREAEGLFLGLSAAINVGAAVRVARSLGPGHAVVTILCDGGARYLSRLHDPQWRAQRGLPVEADGLGFLDDL